MCKKIKRYENVVVRASYRHYYHESTDLFLISNPYDPPLKTLKKCPAPDKSFKIIDASGHALC